MCINKCACSGNAFKKPYMFGMYRQKAHVSLAWIDKITYGMKQKRISINIFAAAVVVVVVTVFNYKRAMDGWRCLKCTI